MIRTRRHKPPCSTFLQRSIVTFSLSVQLPQWSPDYLLQHEKHNPKKNHSSWDTKPHNNDNYDHGRESLLRWLSHTKNCSTEGGGSMCGRTAITTHSHNIVGTELVSFTYIIYIYILYVIKYVLLWWKNRCAVAYTVHTHRSLSCCKPWEKHLCIISGNV